MIVSHVSYRDESRDLPCTAVKQEWANPNSPGKMLRASSEEFDIGDNWEATANSANNRLALKQQPNFLQRKCYLNENRSVFSRNSHKIRLKECEKK